MSLTDPILVEQNTEHIRSAPCPNCYLCGSTGEPLYEVMKDRLFGAPGTWNLKRCPNMSCGLLWLDPMPLEQDMDKAYRSYYTHQNGLPIPSNLVGRIYSRIRQGYLSSKYGYGSVGRNIWDWILTQLTSLNPPRQEIFNSFVFWLKSIPNGRLLELGCGNGTMLKSMQDLGWHVEGVDFDPIAVEEARRKGLTVHLGTLEEQRLPAGSFDAIVGVHVVEHVPDPIRMLRECHRLLKAGGILTLVTPNAGSWGHRLYRTDWRGLEPPRHLRIFTRSAMMTACVQAGFFSNDCRSIVRSNSILVESSMLRHIGRSDSARLSSFRIRLWAEMTALLQWAVSLVDHDGGEEILLISNR